MLAQVRDARLAGRLGEAEALLEAALRIAPNDARLWLELAEVRFAGGEFESARSLADRAVALSGGDAGIVEAAQRLSAQIGD
jgi:Flp pilus assembly protein TadD